MGVEESSLNISLPLFLLAFASIFVGFLVKEMVLSNTIYPTHSLTHPPIYLHPQPPIHPTTHSPNQPFTHQHTRTHPPTYLHPQPLIHPPHTHTHSSLTHSLTHPPTHLPASTTTHPPPHPPHTHTHLSMSVSGALLVQKLDGQTEVADDTREVISHENVLALQVSVGNGRLLRESIDNSLIMEMSETYEKNEY